MNEVVSTFARQNRFQFNGGKSAVMACHAEGQAQV